MPEAGSWAPSSPAISCQSFRSIHRLKPVDAPKVRLGPYGICGGLKTGVEVRGVPSFPHKTRKGWGTRPRISGGSMDSCWERRVIRFESADFFKNPFE